MEIKASIHNLRISPQKVRLAIDVIRGMNLKRAMQVVAFMNRGAAVHILKLLKSAEANAKNNFELKSDSLFIKSIIANEGTTLKRYMPRAHGRADVIRKRASHIHVTLAERNPEKKEGKKSDTKKTVKDTKKIASKAETTSVAKKSVKKEAISKSTKK